MNPLFTITIDCNKDGKLSLWFQKKENLSADNEMKFRGLLHHFERIIKQDAVVKELEFGKPAKAK